MRERRCPFGRLFNLPVLAAALLVAVLPAAASAQMTAAYLVEPTKVAPKMDGDLSDACWKQAAVAWTYYDYENLQQKPGALATEFRMLYDDKGIYLAITNYDVHMDRIRATHTARNDPGLWQDDCAEIYFDPEAQAIGFTCFKVNSIGTRADYRRLGQSESSVDTDWRGEGTQMAVRKNADSWTIEAFFPWSDLRATAAAGEVWRFDHIRYAFTSGAFQGVTWSPGGMYTRPEDFGYLYFAPAGDLSPDQLVAALDHRVETPWNMFLPHEVLEYSGSGECRTVKTEQIAMELKQALLAALEQTQAAIREARGIEPEVHDPAFSKDLDEMERECKPLSPTSAEPLAQLQFARLSAIAIRSKVSDLYWKTRLQLLLDKMN